MTIENKYIPPIVFHPGETLEEKLEEIEMGSKEFAVRTGRPEKTISEILNGKSSITPDMATAFERVLKIPYHFWMNAQGSYNEYLARKKEEELFEKEKDWARKFPYVQMAKLGWVPSARDARDKAKNLYAYFGIGDAVAWERYYLNESLLSQFRVSLKHSREPEAISAWLRHGEIAAQGKEVPEYSEKKFKQALITIKEELMAKQPPDFFEKLQQYCMGSGVYIVATPCLPKAPINGCTRWIKGNPLIQLSGRYKRNDSFWFTFFHEAGHIIKHGKKAIFIETDVYKKMEAEKESEADNFAANLLFPEQGEKELLSKAKIVSDDVEEIAQKYKTHPAMIIGRLQHKKVIDYSIGNEFIIPIDLTQKPS